MAYKMSYKEKQTNHTRLHQSQTQFHGCSTCNSEKHSLNGQPENVALSNLWLNKL